MFRPYLVLIIMVLSFPLSGCYSENRFIDPVEEEAANPYFWSFGPVEEGVVLEHEFTLTNKSTEILNIKNTHTSCGCTVSQVKKKMLLPGESTTIEVSFNTKGYSGSVEQFVYVTTDSAENSVVKFTIKADVIKKRKGGK